MKAVVYDEYGSPDILRLEEVPKPSPGPGEVLIKLNAVSLNRSDWETLRGEPLYARIGGLRRPRHRILGSDIAGRVEAAGADVGRFEPGDGVFGDVLGSMGGFAEYVCAPEKVLALKPASMTFQDASAIPQAGVIALQAIRDKGKVRPGQHVLINGAGGGAGTFAIQLAKLDGAEVTAVDHTNKLDFLRTLGADHVIDYTEQDFTRSGRQYELILDLFADRSVTDYRRALSASGTYFFVGGSMATLAQVVLLGPLVGGLSRRIRLLMVQSKPEDLVRLTDLCQAGDVIPAIDRYYPLHETPDALRYLGEGRAKGKVVITLEEEDDT